VAPNTVRRARNVHVGRDGKARKPPKLEIHATFGRAKAPGEAVSKNPGENGQRKSLCRRHF